LLFLFGSFLFSLAFMQVAFLFTIWTPIGIWTILYFLQTRKKEKIKAIKRAFILFIAWCATNIWWLYPMYILSKYAFSDRLTGQSSIDTLRGVSQYFPSEQIFILKQSFGFGELSPWFGFYSNNFILSLSVIIFALVLMGIGFYKSKSSFLLVILLFVGWFVSKGSNPPFGNEFFTFLFEKIPFLGVLRNSYEKFGLVFVVPYTIYFVLAIHYLTFGLKNLHRKILLGAIFIGILVLNYPLISGQVFSMNKVRVPQDYDVVNDFIKKEKKDSRILIMPMLPGDGIDYSWGYVGVEASEYFFDNPSISKMLRQPYFDDKYMIMIDRYVRNENIYEEMNELGIGYVLLNEDVLGERRNASTSAEVKKYLSQFEKIKLINKEGAISLYEYNGNKNTDLIVTQGDGAPNIAYKKINSGEYEVSVMGAKEPFDLILKNSFSPLWKAQIDEKIVANHSLIYNYANVWNIEKRGDFIVKVKFKVWPWD